MNDKDKFSSVALSAMIICSLLSPTLFVNYISSKVGTDSWMVSILGGLIFLPVIGLWIALSNKFPEKNILEIMELVYGKVFGKILGLYYVFHFFWVACANSDVVGEFFVGYVMPETPKAAIMFLFLLLCAYTVRKGAGTIAKCSLIFVGIVFAVSLINTGLLLNKMDFKNFLPFFQSTPYKFYQATLTSINIPYGETVILFMFLPRHKNPKNVKKAVLTGLLIGGVIALMLLVRDIAVLGNTINYLANPDYEAIRLINLANVLTRMEVIYAAVLLMLLFYKVTICLYTVVKGLEQVFNLASYKQLTFPIGGLMICSAMAAFTSSIEQAFWGTNYAPYFSSTYVFFIPLLTTIVAAIRGFKKPKEASAA